MAILPANVDYSDKDFDALRARMIKLIRSVFPTWTDFDVANFGNLLMELFCFVGDVFTFNQDGAAREGFTATATQRKSMIALARKYGYQIPGPAAATATLEVTLPAVPSADVVFNVGQEVRTPEVTEPVRFQLTEQLTIAAGTNPPTGEVQVEHSKTHSQTFAASALAGQDVILDKTPFLDGSAEVEASNGAYEEVSSFFASTAQDRHYVVLVDQNDRATVRFGDGVRGAVPTGSGSIVYKTGGGARGNVEAGRITVIEGTFRDANGRTVRPTCTNPERATGGDDRQTIEETRLAMPESLRVGNRCVTREDFEIEARQVPGVARALMTTSNEDAAVDENAGIIYLVPTTGGSPSQGLIDAVVEAVTVTKPNTLTFELDVLGATYKVVNVWVRASFAAGQTPTTVRDRIRAALAEFFAIMNDDGTPNGQIDFGINIEGGALAWSDVFNVARDTAGVRKIVAGDFQLNGVSADVNLTAREFPIMGDVVVVDASTGEEI